MPSISISELGKRFLAREVAPHGPCVVVPGDEFDPDWEALLTDQGYACIMTDLDGAPVTLVVLTKASHGSEVKQVYSPEAKEPSIEAKKRRLSWHDPGFFWSEKEDRLLVELWNREPKLGKTEIAKYFPKRTVSAVHGELQRLRNAQKIKPRERGGQRKHQPTPAPAKSKESSVSTTPTPTPTPMEAPASAKPAPKTLPISITVTINVDCSNPVAMGSLQKFLKEMRT